MSIIIQRAALYARFSSDNQRTESIDAQVRAMKKYCQQQHWQIVATYTDEAKSATTDNRPQFQQMIADSSKGIFDIVLVHKLDRFSRNRYDSAIYKSKLKKNHVSIASVLERIDDSPESVMMEAMLEGMAEYYSKNLSREVMKGMNETALQCKHTGGCCPLGYTLDSGKHLQIVPHEAEAVRIIFDRFDRGYGYSEIINFLNNNGYKTKKGSIFRKNSLYEILGNEKYTGTFVFNKASSKDNNHRNNHSYKAYDDVIRIENGCPKIISKELFDRVQKRREANKRTAGRYHSKEFYLLTGKVFCGICGKRMIGNVRFSGRNKTRLATYRCNTHKFECKNKEVNKDYLDCYISDLLEQKVFNSKVLRKIVADLNKYICKYNQQYNKNFSGVEAELKEVRQNLENITKAIERGILTDSIIERAEQLEQYKAELETQLTSLHLLDKVEYLEVSHIPTEYQNVPKETEEYRSLIQQYIKKITVFPYHLEIQIDTGLGIADSLFQNVTIRRGELYEMFESKVREENKNV